MRIFSRWDWTCSPCLPGEAAALRLWTGWTPQGPVSNTKLCSQSCSKVCSNTLSFPWGQRWLGRQEHLSLIASSPPRVQAPSLPHHGPFLPPATWVPSACLCLPLIAVLSEKPAGLSETGQPLPSSAPTSRPSMLTQGSHQSTPQFVPSSLYSYTSPPAPFWSTPLTPTSGLPNSSSCCQGVCPRIILKAHSFHGLRSLLKGHLREALGTSLFIIATTSSHPATWFPC